MLPSAQFAPVPQSPEPQPGFVAPAAYVVRDKSARNPIIGSSPVLLAALEQARQAARSGADILLEAESGTGKELLARLDS